MNDDHNFYSAFANMQSSSDKSTDLFQCFFCKDTLKIPHLAVENSELANLLLKNSETDCSSNKFNTDEKNKKAMLICQDCLKTIDKFRDFYITSSLICANGTVKMLYNASENPNISTEEHVHEKIDGSNFLQYPACAIIYNFQLNDNVSFSNDDLDECIPTSEYQ
ncbi:hypothetical protein EDEG_01474 [Edhazardia aedis USNM 41457]|uniref:ZAD domain-containing protein n=1 Tax=Edhazardia aedis (strain USNM 41457) TaxID=1003232 RepID=J9DSE7_EDHAE|nr:hypothetical protein EDEG_01474 [Edhazardia aedis USNM 41457]|eukprot:EJW04242.1 hypothetical protein EDEG_01474 [Edhazardia aedis USNM 41457]